MHGRMRTHMNSAPMCTTRRAVISGEMDFKNLTTFLLYTIMIAAALGDSRPLCSSHPYRNTALPPKWDGQPLLSLPPSLPLEMQ